MLLAFIAIIAGLALLIWSTDRFIDGAAVTSRHFGMSPLLIGMVVVGFGTSLPEMVVSVISASEGNAGVALGNAYGSNITNIALILGLTALINPLTVQSKILRKELPVLGGCTLLSAWQIWDGHISRLDAIVLLSVFALLMGWTIWQAVRNPTDELEAEMERELSTHTMPIKRAVVWLLVGLVLLVVSSRMLVWGAVFLARYFGVSDLVIGLTIVAAGTSLPELATSAVAAVRGRLGLSAGNLIGSDLFNILGVLGLTAALSPLATSADSYPGLLMMCGQIGLLLVLLRTGWQLSRREGLLLVACSLARWGASFT